MASGARSIRRNLLGFERARWANATDMELLQGVFFVGGLTG